MIKTKEVQTPDGQTIWIEFEQGYHDGKGRWRVIDIEVPGFEVGDTIHPEEIGVGWQILKEDEEDDVVFRFVEEDGTEHNPVDMAGDDPELQAMVKATNDVLREFMPKEGEDGGET